MKGQAESLFTQITDNTCDNCLSRNLTPSVADSARTAYAMERRDHWDKTAQRREASSMSSCYQDRLLSTYRFLINPGLRVLEVGCGRGNLLAGLDPAEGVGIDFAPAMIAMARQRHPRLTFIQMDIHDLDVHDLPQELARPFDAIILSDLVNDLWDTREVLESIKPLFKRDTRLFLNFHSYLWERPFALAQRFNLVTPRLVQNWFTPDDMRNMLDLAGFEAVWTFDTFLWPWKVPVLEPLCNRFLSKIAPFRWLSITHFMVCRFKFPPMEHRSVSVVVPARNEAGNIEAAVQRIPEMGAGTEIIFVEGNSTDNTWDVIKDVVARYSNRRCKALRQPGKGKGDAVRAGFAAAEGDILMILDADLTTPPESLPQFYHAIASGKAEFVNGVRLVYPQEKEAMRFWNLVGNKFFSLAFSWLLDRSIKDTLCGTKVLSRNHYREIAENRSYFGQFDPFGDFDLLFGAAKLNLKIVDLPVRYRSRTYGETNISRWRDGSILLRMALFAALRIKFAK